MLLFSACDCDCMLCCRSQLLVSVGVPESRVPDILMAGSPASSTSTFLKSLSIPDSLMQELRAHRDVAPQGESDTEPVKYRLEHALHQFRTVEDAFIRVKSG